MLRIFLTVAQRYIGLSVMKALSSGLGLPVFCFVAVYASVILGAGWHWRHNKIRFEKAQNLFSILVSKRNQRVYQFVMQISRILIIANQSFPRPRKETRVTGLLKLFSFLNIKPSSSSRFNVGHYDAKLLFGEKYLNAKIVYANKIPRSITLPQESEYRFICTG